MHFVLNKIVNFNQLTIVGVIRKENDNEFFSLKIKKSKSIISVFSLDTFSNFESLISKLDKKIPVILVIDGKGILNKKIDFNNEIDSDWVKKIDYNTIHFSSCRSNTFQFFSFCRMNVSEEIIQNFQTSGFQILDVYIGPIIAAILHKNIQKTNLFSNDSILKFDFDDLIDIVKSNEANEIITYEIGNATISNFYLPLYAAGINFYLNQKNIEKTESNLINKEEIIYKRSFEIFGLTMLISFFIMLLASYSLIQYYNSKNTELKLETIYSGKSYELIKKMEESKKRKLDIIYKTGIGSSKYNSFYAFKIAESTPSGISLSNLEIHPIQKEIKTNKGIELLSNVILLKGQTQNEDIFNVWLTKLKTQDWIRKLEIVSIKKDRKNITLFELKISVKNV